MKTQTVEGETEKPWLSSTSEDRQEPDEAKDKWLKKEKDKTKRNKTVQLSRPCGEHT